MDHNDYLALVYLRLNDLPRTQRIATVRAAGWSAVAECVIRLLRRRIGRRESCPAL